MSELIHFDPRRMQKGLAITARNLQGQFTEAQGQVKRVNERSLEWVQNRAARELDEAIAEHGRPQQYNTGNLRRAILDPNNSSSDLDGFRFMIHERVKEEVPYYRAIEEGDESQVGKTRTIGFFHGGALILPFNARGQKHHGLPTVVIKNPVPRYAYADKATKAFLRAGIYKRYIRTELKQLRKAGVGIR